MIILGGNTTSANFAPTVNDHAWLVGLDLDGNWMWGKFFYNVSYALTTISGCHLSSDGLSINLFGVGNNVPVIMDINSKNGTINKFLHIEYTQMTPSNNPVFTTYGAMYYEKNDEQDKNQYLYCSFVMNNKIEMLRMLVSSTTTEIDWSQELNLIPTNEITDLQTRQDPVTMFGFKSRLESNIFYLSGRYQGFASVGKFKKNNGELIWAAKLSNLTKINAIVESVKESVFYGCGDNFENEDFKDVSDFQTDYNYTAGVFKMQPDGQVKWFVKFGGKNPVSTAKSQDRCFGITENENTGYITTLLQVKAKEIRSQNLNPGDFFDTVLMQLDAAGKFVKAVQITNNNAKINMYSAALFQINGDFYFAGWSAGFQTQLQNNFLALDSKLKTDQDAYVYRYRFDYSTSFQCFYENEINQIDAESIMTLTDESQLYTDNITQNMIQIFKNQGEIVLEKALPKNYFTPYLSKFAGGFSLQDTLIIPKPCAYKSYNLTDQIYFLGQDPMQYKIGDNKNAKDFLAMMDENSVLIYQSGQNASDFANYNNQDSVYIQTDSEDKVGINRLILRNCDSQNNLLELNLYVNVQFNSPPQFITTVQTNFTMWNGNVTTYKLPDWYDDENNDVVQIYVDYFENKKDQYPPFLIFDNSTNTITLHPNDTRTQGKKYQFSIVIKEKNSHSINYTYHCTVEIFGIALPASFLAEVQTNFNMQNGNVTTYKLPEWYDPETNDQAQIYVDYTEGKADKYPSFLIFENSTKTITLSPNDPKYSGKKYFFTVVVISNQVQYTYNSTVQILGATLEEKVDFLSYTAKFGKTYASTDEFNLRFLNWKRVNSFIQDQEILKSSVNLTHNKFSDWSLDEKDQILNHKLASQPIFSYYALPTQLNSTNGTCPIGYVVVNKTFCMKCPAGCKSCPQSLKGCLSCISDKFQLLGTNCTCFTGAYNATINDCNVCGDNQFYPNNTCESCNVNFCKNCKKNKTCSMCLPGFTLSANGSQCICEKGFQNETSCIKCASNQFVRNNQCVNCPQNCSTCANSTGACLTCINPTYSIQNEFCQCPSYDYFLNESLCVKYTYCGTAQYNTGNNSCKSCPKFCSACNMFTGSCFACEPTFDLVDGNSLRENQTTLSLLKNYCTCPTNYFEKNGTCVSLIQCPTGQYNDGQNKCKQCALNCGKCENVTGTCLECQDLSFNLTEFYISNLCLCPGEFVVQYDGKCAPKQNCSSKYYNNGKNTCLPCQIENCNQCEDVTGTCSICYPSFTLMNNSCQCNLSKTFYDQKNNYCDEIIQPITGQRNMGNNTFELCTQNYCDQCIYDKDNCTKCQDSFNLQDNQCVCPNQDFWINPLQICTKLKVCGLYYWNDGFDNCKECPKNCKQCNNFNGTCTVCKDTIKLNQDGSCACPQGQYFSSNQKCLPCSANCQQCFDQTGYCQKCKIESFTIKLKNCVCNDLIINGECVKYIDCPTGQFNDGQNNCNSCGQNANICFNYQQAIQCQDTYSLINGSCQCRTNQIIQDGKCVDIDDCGDYFYNDGQNNCVQCPDNCTQCTSSNQCTSCRDTLTLQNGRCSCSKQQYQYIGDEKCYNCENSLCDTCRDLDGLCTSCKDAWTYNRAKCYCWPPGWLNGTDCSSCPVGCWSCFNQTCYSCKPTFQLINNTCQCSQGQFVNQSGLCQNCADNTLNCSENTGLATKCQNNFDNENGKCVCQNKKFVSFNKTTNQTVCSNLNNCSIGKYNIGNNTCVTCPKVKDCINCNIQNGVPKCSQCNTTFTLNIDGSCSCKSNQYIAQDKTCKPCSNNTLICANQSGLSLQCRDNLSIINGTCRCKTDQYLTDKCYQCLQNCASCKNGQKCDVCSNSFSVQTDGTCNCTKNQYYSATNNSCVNVYTSPGQANNGQNIFTPCIDNCTSCNISTIKICNTCKSTFNKTSVGSCECQENLIFINQTCQAVKKCKNGTYNDGTNLCKQCHSNCSQCSGPQNCTACKSTFKFENQNKCICPSGSYLNSENLCVLNPLNCSRANDTTGICTNCKETFTYNQTSNKCLCNSNQFYSTNKIENCKNCPDQCSKCNNSSNCLSCNLNYELKNGVCACNTTYLDNQGQGCIPYIACPIGKWNDKLNGCNKCSPGCTSCQDFSGACEKCEDNYYLLAGICSISSKSQNQSQSEKDFSLNSTDSSILLSSSNNQVDWRYKNVINPVRDQGLCGGGDYAFSSSAVAESNYAIKTGNLYNLSRQFLIDCDQQSQGCSGGWKTTASFLLSTSGAVLESDYKFANKTQMCKGKKPIVFNLTYPGSIQINSSRDSFKSALIVGPLDISYKITGDVFYQYGSGIILANNCNSADLVNHSMVAVGFGTENGIEYAIIQNQWGTDWGESGYLRVELDSDGLCGIYSQTLASLV